jgi:transcriptional regulator of acetoin/glycerol metabolism
MGIQLFSEILRKQIFSKIDRQTPWDKEELKLEILVCFADATAKYADISNFTKKFSPNSETNPASLTPLEEREREMILQVLLANSWNISRSAKLLGIDRKTLRTKIRHYGITSEDIYQK